MKAVVSFERVSKSYPYYHHITAGIKNFLFHLPRGLKSIKNNRHRALQDVSFRVFKGEAFGITGKNGAGKSTILGLIAGVLQPNEGRVEVMGRISPLLELGAGFHPELTGRENIVLKGVLIGLSRTEVLERIDEIIRFSELEEFIDQPVRIYSSGMLARLGFSIVACLDPEILLIDEILAVGDRDFQKKCLNRMAEFKRRGVTIILVSHSAEHLRGICDRVMLLENSRVKVIGDSLQVLGSALG